MSVIGHNKPHVSVNSLSTQDKQKLKNAIDSLNDSMTRAMAEREHQKNVINEAFDELGLDKKLIRRLARAYFKANFNEEVEENKNFEEMYSVVIKGTVNDQTQG
jgi:hypothetical protein